MKSITTTALLIVLSIGAIQCVNWSNITATELGSLPSDIFATITPAELASIPPEACQGFQAIQVGNLTASAASGLNDACLSQFPAPACLGFGDAFIGAMDPQAFAGWTVECTKQLPALAFAQVKAEQWALINSSACNGFGFDTVKSFNSTSGGGVTAACVAQFTTKAGQSAWYSGCSGLRGAFVGSIDGQAFSGFQPLCIQQTATETFSQVSSDQLAAVTDSVCFAFGSTHVGSFPPSAAPGLKIGCLANFSDSGCLGLRDSFVGQMTPVTFEGLKHECVAAGRGFMFASINSTQMSHIPPLAFQGLYSAQAANITDEAWTGASKSQLFYLTSGGFNGLRASSLKIVVNIYALELVNIFTVAQTYQYPLKSAAEFKSYIPAQVAFMTSWDTVAQDLSTATWLKIALLKKGDQSVQGPVFDEMTLKSLPFSAFQGLRVDHVPLIAASDFKLFNETHSQYFTNDTVSAISADQLRELSPVAFGALNAFSLSGINVDVVPAITGNQITYLTLIQIQYMNCDQLQAFTVAQLSQFNEDQKSSFTSTYRRQCGVVAPPFGVASPLTATPTTDAPQSTDSPINTPSDSTQGPLGDYTPQAIAPSIDTPSDSTQGPSGSNEPMSGGKLFLIIAGIALGVALISGVIFFFVRRRRADPTRQPLLAVT